ncbi:CYFA0S01e05996g1_1 [Cyberlindnera fabianii]|uniref:CYFA0S01e05996g1_1 n=1 Tax=Cyberlindnera fabianii TaxID=36022 RepID=A0A061AHG5_CYBFA|nr:CYFA0S01e05996g1_1 [Cyberlindnera fabianii]
MSDEYLRAMEAQRRAFEAQFGSLEEMGFEDKTKQMSSDEHESDTSSESSSNEDEDEDLGVYQSGDSVSSEEDESDDNESTPVVVKFTDSTREYTGPSKTEQKLLKSGKSYVKPKAPPKSKQRKTKEDEDDIKNDLELQRFLDESHILANFQSQNSGADLTLQTMNSDGMIGNARKHTINSRLKQLSGINSTKDTKLEKMPISMRKGMVKSRQDKIAKYEQEARDGGIVLSHVKKGEFRKIGGSLTIDERIGTGIKSKLDSKRRFRQKGLKINSVGRSTKNGLVISQRDIDRINGPPPGTKGKGKGKRR